MGQEPGQTIGGTEGARLRIVQVSGLASGGIRTHLADCSRLLAALGHDVIVEAPASVISHGDYGAARLEALEISSRPTLHDSLVRARLARLGRRADVVHAHGLRAGALAALALGPRRARSARLVVTQHNLTVGGPVVRGIGSLLECVVARGADCILAVSPDIAQRARHLGASQVELAVIPAPNRPGDACSATAPQVWPDGVVRLLTVARLAPQKGIDLALDAARELSARPDLPGLEWAIAGDGPDGDRLRRRITQEGLPVTLIGRREDIPQLMRGADVVVQTSLWEGQPLTVQEALRSGSAIVATDVGGTAHTARGGAILVPPSALAIADAVAHLMRDGAALEEARHRSRSAAESLPGVEDLGAQLLRVYGGIRRL